MMNRFSAFLLFVPIFFTLSDLQSQPRGEVFINAVVDQLLQVNQLRARNVIISGNLLVEGLYS